MGRGNAFARDFQSLSLFRILFALWLFADLIADHAAPPVLVAVHVPAILAFGFGYRTRWACMALLLLMIVARPVLSLGAQHIPALLLLWCAFLPMGRYWSIDAALDRAPRDRAYPFIPFLALRLQIVLLYVFAVLHGLADLGLCLICLMPLVPDAWWNRLLRCHRERLGKIRIYFDPGCAFCEKTALLFREFCLTASVPVLPADQNAEALRLLRAHNSWVVYGVDGAAYLKWRAVAYVLRQSPVFALFGWLSDLPFLRGPMESLYGFIGNHRKEGGKVTALLLPFCSEPALHPAAQGLCVLLMVVVFGYIIRALIRL